MNVSEKLISKKFLLRPFFDCPFTWAGGIVLIHPIETLDKKCLNTMKTKINLFTYDAGYCLHLLVTLTIIQNLHFLSWNGKTWRVKLFAFKNRRMIGIRPWPMPNFWGQIMSLLICHIWTFNRKQVLIMLWFTWLAKTTF